MEVQYGPNSLDEPSLLYKLQRKIKVFNTCDLLPNRGYNLVANSSKYGLVFITAPEGLLTVYQLNQLIDKENEPQHLTIQLQEKPTHIAVSCDNELLAVTGGQLLCVYKVTDFQNANVSPSIAIKTEVNPATFVSALQWNPCIPDSIAIAYYDGTLLASQVSNGQVKKVPSKARCICWSPKGKQLVTGNSDGTLIQFKPDLTAAKLVPVPNLFEGSPVEAMAIYWISTFQFAVVYKNATDNSRPAVTIVNTPKAGQPCCITYEDICYSIGSNRPWYYYLQGLAQWNIIMTSSSNSVEIGTLGSVDGSNWVQWCQIDEARPELPLTDKKIENYPVGISIDNCAIHQLPWGENETLPHMPLLHVITQNGLLVTFNIINMKKEAVQVCAPPQLLTLPAHAMTSSIPGEAPEQPVAAPPPSLPPAPAPVPVKAEAKPPVIQQVVQPAVKQSIQQVDSANSGSIKIPSFTPQSSFAFANSNQVPEIKQAPEIKPAPAPQAPAAQPKPQPAMPSKPELTPQQVEENAALKAEQQKLNKIKADEELKNMLIKVVNDFQMELYNFMVKTRETQITLQHDIQNIGINFNGISIDTDQLKKECSIEELRGAIIQLKLELVRACAVVAEARTHADAKDLHQWTQADPLTTKRVASVKKLAYYVQTQLEQAHKALDHKWNEFALKDPMDPLNKPGRRMIRPILDDVYQPLVKQQEILSRQEAIIRTLKNTLNECDIGPMFKSTSLLRSTPFRNKDPLSKLTKNILNMSIESQTKPKQSLLSAQKLEALRDVLSNHKTVKIKPVNVELRQHLATMRKNYEKSLKEKAQAVNIKVEPEFKPQVQSEVKPAPPQHIVRTELNQEVFKQTKPTPTFTPVSKIKPVAPPVANVARTLFTDEPKQEPPKPQAQVQRPVSKPFGYTGIASEPPAVDTKSVLKDILTNKQANLEAKNNNNTFMGQKICSPTAFGKPSATTSFTPTTTATSSFTSKPIAEINNTFTKFQRQPFVSETKSTLNIQTTEKPPAKPANVKSSETGEPEETLNASKPFDYKAKDKPITNLFAMKTTPVASSTPAAPKESKGLVQDQKPEIKISVKPPEKLTENAKENISSQNVPITVQKPADKKEMKPLNQAQIGEPQSLALKPEGKNESTKESVTAISSASSIFASANISTADSKSPSAFTSLASTKTESTVTNTSESDQKLTNASTALSASSIFGAAVASQPKTTSSIFPSSPTSVFSSSAQSSEPSAFGTTKSIFSSSSPAFGTTTTSSSIFGQTSTTQSVFSSTAASVFATASQSQPQLSPTSPPNVTAVTTATTPVLSSPATTSSVFGSMTPTSLLETTTTPAPSFETTTASIFGSKSSTQTSLFGTTTPTTVASVFGASEATPNAFTATSSLFGTATTTASIFSTTTTPSVFGQAAQSAFGTTTQASIFGSTATQPSVFGSPTTQASVFGSPTATSQSSVFGASTQASIFGTPTQTTQTSVFGTPTQTTQASIFGTPTSTTQSSIFGTPTPTTQTSVFGTPTTQTSLFGQPATTAQSGSLFGGGEANLFASASISTTSASTTPGSGGNIFGGSFSGGSTNVFGGKATFGQQNQTTSNIFGGGATFGQQPPTNLWGSGTSTGGGFGSTTFGQQATTQASSIFGGATGGSFSQPSAGAFGSPPQQSAFGSPTQQQQPGAFGGSPVFGSKPAFGQPAGFGSPTSSGFGSPASFGGFSKSPGGSGFGAPAFGGASFGGTFPGGGFGTGTQSSNATFESLATQNTLTFGNLAQQSAPAQQSSPSFTSPSFTGWRG